MLLLHKSHHNYALGVSWSCHGSKKRLGTNISVKIIDCMSTTNTKPAVNTAASPGAINIARLTAAQIEELVAQHNKNQEAKFAQLETELAEKFQECKDILAQMKEINAKYEAEWEITEAPQACGYDIKEWLKLNGGSATKADIHDAMKAKYSEEKINKTLTNRCSGEMPLWTFDAENESFTLIKKNKTNKNN